MEPEDLDPIDPRVRWLRWVIFGLLAVGFGACMAEGANNPPDPVVTESSFPDFGEIGFRISPPTAGTLPSTTELCALLAATPEQRSQGLMTVTDLKGYPGMIFRYPADSTGGFFMRNTPMPLSIAFFAADGQFVSAADMEPCDDRSDCPVTSATGPYRFALEVPKGQLPALGIGPGSVLQVTGACPST